MAEHHIELSVDALMSHEIDVVAAALGWDRNRVVAFALRHFMAGDGKRVLSAVGRAIKGDASDLVDVRSEVARVVSMDERAESIRIDALLDLIDKFKGG
jgi:hypothetical protein